MTVNSRRGPLDWVGEDSAFVTTDAHPPAPGIDAGLIHASSENGDVRSSALASGTVTWSLTPSNRTAVLPALAGSRLGWASAGPLPYVPGWPPTSSAAL